MIVRFIEQADFKFRMSSSMPNWFDFSIITFFNGFARRSPTFDEIVTYVASNTLIKAGVLVTLLWWAWFRSKGDKERTRERVLATILAAFVSVFIGRSLALTLPFSARPIDNPLITFQVPYFQSPQELSGWSSFPSDHAALVFALATGLLMVSRFIGVLALIHAFFVVSLPRIYLGLHYPTDIIAGMFIGVATAYLVNRSTVERAISRAGLKWEQKYPSFFYPLFFLVTYQIATLFDDVRSMGRLSFDIIKVTLKDLH
ncbi:MAG: hypothetical protein DMG13_02585 [Acidobacteria bacterium]|nr:MAG: hypothetical protein DMG13_02585 [Acidobacteriota bacterium]